MTCIVGLVHEGSVWIGGDSAATNEASQLAIRADSKVFFQGEKGEFLFGCTSSYRMVQLLRYELVIPRYEEEDDLFRFLVRDFINAVRTCLKDGGFATREQESEKGGKFLVGFRGRLICIDHDYQAEETLCGYNAVGGGDDIALGVMYATQQLDMEPSRRIRLALEAAAYHNAEVRPPFRIEECRG